jgi:3'-phosphoadenosine 5'-phosphosulfate sulfotransferase (PAPS reductase)/FAD synthetase
MHYTKGFVSIGCALYKESHHPDEDIRAGRWWWEPVTKNELHSSPVFQRGINEVKKLITK